MRNLVSLLPLLSLAACGGAGPQSVGSAAAPAAAPGGTTTNHSFVAPTVQKVYSAIGGVHSYSYTTRNDSMSQSGQLYAGDATTARNSGITVDYNPRDGIFELKIAAPLANVSQTLRFQDPVHRTDFGGASQPQVGTPQLATAGIQYLEAGGTSAPIRFDSTKSDMVPVGDNGGSYVQNTFFYQKPGTTTKYVTFAGFVRNATTVVDISFNGGPLVTTQNNILERGAFAFGERTDNGAVPRTGTATYNGAMIATMVYNPNLDTNPATPTYYQWVEGTSRTTVDFAANSFTLDLTGTVFAPQFDANTTKFATLGQGATFSASGSGRIDLVNAGGFLGQFTTASFSQGGVALPQVIAGSSIDGAFFGPGADEVGGGFRIVGGTPDERIDMIGAFTGGK
jgi:predicted small lipoprotein YifL